MTEERQLTILNKGGYERILRAARTPGPLKEEAALLLAKFHEQVAHLLPKLAEADAEADAEAETQSPFFVDAETKQLRSRVEAHLLTLMEHAQSQDPRTVHCKDAFLTEIRSLFYVLPEDAGFDNISVSALDNFFSFRTPSGDHLYIFVDNGKITRIQEPFV